MGRCLGLLPFLPNLLLQPGEWIQWIRRPDPFSSSKSHTHTADACISHDITILPSKEITSPPVAFQPINIDIVVSEQVSNQ